jgi:rfaE bifunctional protein kinase chain/domain
MTPQRFQAITGHYHHLKVAVVGDFCLDRYLEIDPARQETSLETGLPVHNVVNVRAQPGGAGTILNNLAALGIGEMIPVGFCGVDGEGFELRRALRSHLAVNMDFFVETTLRRTFTYCKPLVVAPDAAPVELNRLDSKNWTATPGALQGQIVDAVAKLSDYVQAIILLEQVEVSEAGVLCARVRRAVGEAGRRSPALKIIADSRRGLREYPPVIFKMNRSEFAAMAGLRKTPNLEELRRMAAAFSRETTQPVFVTAAEDGLLGATPEGQTEHVPALPVRGPIDIVGAGDAVTANLIAALAAAGGLREAMEMASAAASVVIHKLGTTGTASPGEIAALLESP